MLTLLIIRCRVTIGQAVCVCIAGLLVLRVREVAAAVAVVVWYWRAVVSPSPSVAFTFVFGPVIIVYQYSSWCYEALHDWQRNCMYLIPTKLAGMLEHGLADERRMNWSSWRVGGFGIFSCLFSRLPSLVLAPLSLHSFTLIFSNVHRHVRSPCPRHRCLDRRWCSSTALHHQPQSYLLVGYVPKSRLYAPSSDFLLHQSLVLRTHLRGPATRLLTPSILLC